MRYNVDATLFNATLVRPYDVPSPIAGMFMPSLHGINSRLDEVEARLGACSTKLATIYPSMLGGVVAFDEDMMRNAPITRRFYLGGDTDQEVQLTVWGAEPHISVAYDALSMPRGTALAIVAPSVSRDPRIGLLSISINPGTGCVLPLLPDGPFAKAGSAC